MTEDLAIKRLIIVGPLKFFVILCQVEQAGSTLPKLGIVIFSCWDARNQKL